MDFLNRYMKAGHLVLAWTQYRTIFLVDGQKYVAVWAYCMKWLARKARTKKKKRPGFPTSQKQTKSQSQLGTYTFSHAWYPGFFCFLFPTLGSGFDVFCLVLWLVYCAICVYCDWSEVITLVLVGQWEKCFWNFSHFKKIKILLIQSSFDLPVLLVLPLSQTKC